MAEKTSGSSETTAETTASTREVASIDDGPIASGDVDRVQRELTTTYGVPVSEQFARDLVAMTSRKSAKAIRNLVESGKADVISRDVLGNYGFKANEQFARDLIRFVKQHDSGDK